MQVKREGRINRYKGLAIRRTLANRYGEKALSSYFSVAKERGRQNIWNLIFDIAEEEENKEISPENRSGLLPYWGVEDGAGKVLIERHVYNYPYSKDEIRYSYILKTMARYRAVLGQPNQEELLAMLEKRHGISNVFGENFQDLFINLCPFTYDSDISESSLLDEN